MVRLETLPEIPDIDVLLVLGRGIDANGELTQTGLERAQIAPEIARILLPRVVCFTGGRSWRQHEGGVRPKTSEGEAMLAVALAYAGAPPKDVTYVYESESESTVANMVNSHPLMNLQPGETMGILSDELHFAYHRIQNLASLVFPNNPNVPIKIPRLLLPGDTAEERLTAIATRMFMRGVQPGDFEKIMQRQAKLERLNSNVRKIIGFTGRKGELGDNMSQVNASYTDIAAYHYMSIPNIAGAMVQSMAA